MTDSSARPLVVVALVAGDVELGLGSYRAGTRCGLALVEDILRLHLHARRLGWAIRITQADEQLCELLDLVGVGAELGLVQASMRGGSPNSANS